MRLLKNYNLDLLQRGRHYAAFKLFNSLSHWTSCVALKLFMLMFDSKLRQSVCLARQGRKLSLLYRA